VEEEKEAHIQPTFIKQPYPFLLTKRKAAVEFLRFLNLTRELRDMCFGYMITNTLTTEKHKAFENEEKGNDVKEDLKEAFVPTMGSLPHLLFNRGMLQANRQIHHEFARALCVKGQVYGCIVEFPSFKSGAFSGTTIKIPRYLRLFAPYTRSMVLELHSLPTDFPVTKFSHEPPRSPLHQRQCAGISYLLALHELNAFPHLGELHVMLNIGDTDITFAWVEGQMERLKTVPSLFTVTITAFLTFRVCPGDIEIRELVRLRANIPSAIHSSTSVRVPALQSNKWDHATHIFSPANIPSSVDDNCWRPHGQGREYECFQCLAEDPARTLIPGGGTFFMPGYGPGYRIAW
jgi:hypothetical protein